MAKISYRDYATRSYRYSRERKIRKRCDNRYVLTGLSSKEEAENIRCAAVDIINEYGKVTVSDLYDLIGIVGCAYTDNHIGWGAMANIHWRALIRWDEINGWFIEFPRNQLGFHPAYQSEEGS